MGVCAHVSVNLLSRQLTLLFWGVFWAAVSSEVVLLVCKDIFCGKALMLLCTWSESGKYKD